MKITKRFIQIAMLAMWLYFCSVLTCPRINPAAAKITSAAMTVLDQHGIVIIVEAKDDGIQQKCPFPEDPSASWTIACPLPTISKVTFRKNCKL